MAREGGTRKSIAAIAAPAAEEGLAGLFFFQDPTGKHSQEPDIQGLPRIRKLHNVPPATDPASASFIISAGALQS